MRVFRIGSACAVTVLLIAAASMATPVPVIVDNLDAGFTTTGIDWAESAAVDEYNGSSVYTNDVGDTARWTPDLSEAGLYKVFAWWASQYATGGYYDRDSAATYIIVGSPTGSSPLVVDVDQDHNSGQWYLLGTYAFDAGQGGYVELVRDQADGAATSADAVKFCPVPEPAGLVLLAIGGIGVLVRRTKRQRS